MIKKMQERTLDLLIIGGGHGCWCSLAAAASGLGDWSGLKCRTLLKGTLAVPTKIVHGGLSLPKYLT